MDSSSAPAISFRELSKSFGAIHAVRDLSFDVQRGEIFGFLGLNGAGKTTTLRLLLDLLRPTSGSAAVFGRDCRRQSGETRAVIGYLPAEPGFYEDMHGLEALERLGALSGTPVRLEYRDALLDRLELSFADLRRPIREYSSGMKRKLGLIQALQADPPLIILDEPTEGLDPLMQTALNAILFDLRARGRTVFMSSHVLSEVERMCDRIAMIRGGELVLLSTVAEARRLGGRTVRVVLAAPAGPVALPDGMEWLERGETVWSIRAPGEIGELVALLARLPVRDLEVHEPALEDVLRRFYREEGA